MCDSSAATPTTKVPATKPPVRTSSLDLERLNLKSPDVLSYTSLSDLLPSPRAVNSPTASAIAISSGYEISIRNRLVKQAAWAYLQPMSASQRNSSAPNFLRRLFHRLSSLYHKLVRIFHRILHSLSGQVST